MATGELSDHDVFGTQAYAAPGAPGELAPAPPVRPVQAQSLPPPSGVNSYGQPFSPQPVALSDADVFGGAAPAQGGKVSEFMGLEKGLAEPFQRVWGRVSGDPTLKAVSDSVAAAFPEYDAIQRATQRLAPIGMADVNRRAALGYQPGKIGEALGNFADTVVMPGGPLASGALSGALLSKSDDLGGVAKDAAIGAVGGKIAHSVLGGLSSLIAPKIAPQVSTLLDAGIPLTPGQITGGALRRVEDGVSSFPIVGDVVSAAKVRSIQGLNRAVANRALAPIGETLPSDVAPGRDAIAYAGDKLSDRYNALIPSLTMAADGQLGSDIRGIGEAAQNLPQEHAKMLGRIIQQNIIEKIDPTTGVMPGDALKDAESTLGLQIRRYAKSPMPADQNFADGLTLTRQVLRDWVARSNPQAADELSRLNSGWANLAIGENAASRLGANDGLFTPSQLAGAVRGASDTVRKRGYARGEALMQDLSDAAQARLPSTVPDSGSPFRHALEAGVAGLVGKEAGVGAAMGKASVLGALLSAPYTKMGQPIVQGLLAGPRPAYAPTIADIVKRLQTPARALGSESAVNILGAPGQ